MSEESNTLRILIATDNHLGVWENDEARKDDSFKTFDEILRIAAEQNADLVLLAGDLFHDNKPSRRTVVRSMDILSQHCLNDRPIAFQVVSDQSQNFTTGRVNFENPNYNIGLPVFTIHGNHDDPAGADNLSAVDILASSSLVNYFGKVAISGSGAGKIRIAPVLLQKGSTKLALYGLGNIRDERLCRLFSTPNSVEWVRPAPSSTAGVNDWFNVFALHQNRVAHSQAAKNCVREGHLPQFLDVVVWGHEHECLADPWVSAESGGNFQVMQPGSSVATALSEGESKRKHVVLLEVRGKFWRSSKFPLHTVRPFVFDSVALAGQPAVNPEDPKTIHVFLTDKVSSMIEEAVRTRSANTPALPLVRLRVDYTGFSTINTQRFGQSFVNKVANPQDIILWQKAAVKRNKDAAAAAAVAAATAAGTRRDGMDEIRIEDLIATYLQQHLEILPEIELTEALRDYVDKDNKDALDSAVAKALGETQEVAVKGAAATAATTTTAIPILQGEDDRCELGEEGNGVENAEENALVGAIAAAAKKRKAEVSVKATAQRASEMAGSAIAATIGGQKQSYIMQEDDIVHGGADRIPKARMGARGGVKQPRVSQSKTAAPSTSKPRGRRAPAASSTPGLESLKFDSTPAVAGRRVPSRRAAATAANSRLSKYRDTANDGDRSGDEDFMETDVVKDAIVVSDSEEDMELDPEEMAHLRGRRAAPPVSVGVGPAVHPVNLLDSDDDDGNYGVVRPGGTEIGPTPATNNNRSQLLGRFGSQHVSRWGALKE